MEFLILLTISIFVIIEIILSTSSYNNMKIILVKENVQMVKVQQILRKRNEQIIKDLNNEDRSYPPLNYLAICTEREQKIYPETFLKLLSKNTDSAFYQINNTMNLLPIIGLIGTFLGIIIGVLMTWSEIKIYEINANLFSLESSIKPLLFSAGLAFVSSFCALYCASRLKWIVGKKRIESNSILENTLNCLIMDYIPYITPIATEDRFNKTIKELTKNIEVLNDNLAERLSDFISNFNPLLQDLGNIRDNTIISMERITNKLNESTKSLEQLYLFQDKQIVSFSEITGDLKAAITSLEDSMVAAKKNLESFVDLSNEMKTNIIDMNEPLINIINNQDEISQNNKIITDKINLLFENINFIPEYNSNLQIYLSTLNNKLDVFVEVGNSISKTENILNEFAKNLKNFSEDFKINITEYTQLMTNSFAQFDQHISTLFEQRLPQQGKIDFYYYDPKAIAQLDKIAKENKIMIDSMTKYTRSLEENLNRLNQEIDSLRVFGFIRKKKNKREN